MNHYNEICYKKKVLKQVIVRLDFINYIEKEILISEKIRTVIMNYFPQQGLPQLVRFGQIDLSQLSSNDKVDNEYMEGYQYTYLDNQNNKLIISNKFIIFEINEYDTFQKLNNIFSSIIMELFNEKKMLYVQRIGIRFLNIFDEKSVKAAKIYFEKSVASIIEPNFPPTINNLVIKRKLCQIEYQFRDIYLNFRYGYYNPNYPQLLYANSFALDFDCFKMEMINSAQESINFLNEGHDYIQLLFEKNITDELRKVLQNG